MDCPGTRRADADTQLARKFSVPAGHESGTLFVANQDESDLVLATPQCVQDPRVLISREPENHRHTPFHELLYKKIGSRRTTIGGGILRQSVCLGLCVIFGRSQLTSKDRRRGEQRSAADRPAEKFAAAAAPARAEWSFPEDRSPVFILVTPKIRGYRESKKAFSDTSLFSLWLRRIRSAKLTRKFFG